MGRKECLRQVQTHQSLPLPPPGEGSWGEQYTVLSKLIGKLRKIESIYFRFMLKVIVFAVGGGVRGARQTTTDPWGRQGGKVWYSATRQIKHASVVVLQGNELRQKKRKSQTNPLRHYANSFAPKESKIAHANRYRVLNSFMLRLCLMSWSPYNCVVKKIEIQG